MRPDREVTLRWERRRWRRRRKQRQQRQLQHAKKDLLPLHLLLRQGALTTAQRIAKVPLILTQASGDRMSFFGLFSSFARVAIENLIMKLSKQKEKQQEEAKPASDLIKDLPPAMRRTNTKFLKSYFENLAEEEAKVPSPPAVTDSYRYRTVKQRKKNPFGDDQGSGSAGTPRADTADSETVGNLQESTTMS